LNPGPPALEASTIPLLITRVFTFTIVHYSKIIQNIKLIVFFVAIATGTLILHAE